MTGSDVRRVREMLGLDPFAFARVLGVHVSTVYRWEQSANEVKMDPLQAELLDKLLARLRHERAEGRRELGSKVLAALLAGSALLALGLLIGFIVNATNEEKS